MNQPDTSAGASGLSRGQRLAAGLTFSVVFTVVLLEIASRLFWAYWLDVPFFRAGELRTAMHFAYYPNLQPVYEGEIRRDDDVFDVLMLGGSVINTWYGDIEPQLKARLEEATGGPVRMHNVAFPAHGTRDSYHKYRQLAHQRFDLVLVYHGVNDVPVNNIEREHFRDDYSHFLWVGGYNRLTSEPSVTLPFLAFPYTVRFAIAKVKERLPIPGTIPRKNDERYRRQFVHGADLKSPPVFRTNLDSIAAMAQRRGDPLLLMTFAQYLPDDYSLERFNEQALDYGDHRSAVELWGHPENVRRAIDAHNAMVEEVARKYRTLFVDQRQLIPEGGKYFNDMVHLAPGGVAAWVDNVMDGLAPFLGTESDTGAGSSPG